MSNHRREVRPRYGRIAALSTALTVTAVAALAGMGVLASGTASAGVKADAAAYTSSSVTPSPDPSDAASDPVVVATPVVTTSAPAAGESSAAAGSTADTALPASSGSGLRVVFSQSRQRVWLVDAGDDVQRTYLVSGSVTDNLQPGTYEVYSRSRWATGIEDSGVMQYFVRFTEGPTGASIGFHTIPTRNGVPLQSVAQLGTPQSHGCIRQKTPDAVALWDYAPVGTKVVVVA
jgi:lipoprotein-anchoring transpeptidase ErfK/SrfK